MKCAHTKQYVYNNCSQAYPLSAAIIKSAVDSLTCILYGALFDSILDAVFTVYTQKCKFMVNNKQTSYWDKVAHYKNVHLQKVEILLFLLVRHLPLSAQNEFQYEVPNLTFPKDKNQ